VPRHWGLVPNRGLVRKRKVLVGKYHEDYRLLSLTKQGVIVRDISTGKGKFSSDMGTSQEVRNGDLVFCLFDVPETPRTVGLSRYDGMITGAYTVFEPLGRGSSEYFELFYRAMDDRKLLSPLYSGLRNTIPSDRFLGTKTPQPSAKEQAAIVRFLDWANGRLERAIRAKRNVIAVLNEQKQAIIHRAVIRGLDPSVPLKPSGISWLGEIPKHWSVIRGRFLFRAVTRRDVRADDPKLSVTQRNGVIPTNEMKENSTQARSFDRFQVCHREDLVLNKYKAHLGVFWCAMQRGLITPNYTVFRPARELNTKYFELLFHTRFYCDAFSMIVYGVTEGMSPLYTQDFYSLPVVFPPPDEQRQIVVQVSILTKREDAAISRLEREMELLREYRTRLVADVVTGKLDVRKAAAHLPEEATTEADTLNDTDALDEAELADEEAAA
jgi:type I restriction enzyme S subunit